MSEKDQTKIDDPMAEFHDIGKIVDWKAVGLQKSLGGGTWEREPEDFEKCKQGWGINYAAKPWQSVFRHDKDHCLEFRKKYWPNSLIWCFAEVADGLAAGFSRQPLKTEGMESPGRYSLWSQRQETPTLIKTESDLRALIKFVNSADWQQVLDHTIYGAAVRQRAEEKAPGLNVTSLYQHCLLTGKIARALANSDLGNARAKIAEQTLKSRKPQEGAFSKIAVHLYYCEVAFVQRPFRSRELGLFELRRQLIKQVADEFPDNVLLTCGPKMLLVFFGRDEFDNLASRFSKAGFIIYVHRIEDNLKEFWGKPKPQPYGLERILDGGDRKLKKSVHYSAPLPPTIELPICESCQMAHADKHWPEDAGPMGEGIEQEAQEDLCSSCFESRSRAIRLSKMKEWLSGRVAWVHVFIRMKDEDTGQFGPAGPLGAAIVYLHRQYLKDLISKGKTELPKEVQAQLDEAMRPRLPIVADFIADYGEFLSEFSERLVDTVSRSDVSRLDQELWCVHIERSGAIESILSAYYELLKSHFGAMLIASRDVPFPISLRVSISNIKYPFFTHWRFLDEHSFNAPNADVAIQAVGSGVASLCATAIPSVVEATKRVSQHAFHRLASIARTSERLAKLVLEDKTDKNKRDFRTLKTLVNKHKIDFRSLVTLSNLLSK